MCQLHHSLTPSVVTVLKFILTQSNMRKCGWHSADDMGSSLMGFFWLLLPTALCTFVLFQPYWLLFIAVFLVISSHTLWLVSCILNQCVIASMTSLSSGLSWWQKCNASWPQYIYFFFLLSEIKVVKNRFVVYNSLKGFHSPNSRETAYFPSYVFSQREGGCCTGGGHFNICHLL